jgi:type IV pilus modification protein PilV
MLDSRYPQTPNANGTNEGFTLIEVMVALVVFAFGIIAVLAMQTTAIRGGHQSQNLTKAASFGADVIERSIVRPDYEDVDDGNATNGKYNAVWTVTPQPANTGKFSDTKAVNLTVSWTEGGRTHRVAYEFFKVKDI